MKEINRYKSDAQYLADLFRSEAERILREHGEFVVGTSVNSERSGKSVIYYALRSHLKDTVALIEHFEAVLEHSPKKPGGLGYFVESQEKMDSLQGTLYEKVEVV